MKVYKVGIPIRSTRWFVVAAENRNGALQAVEAMIHAGRSNTIQVEHTDGWPLNQDHPVADVIAEHILGAKKDETFGDRNDA